MARTRDKDAKVLHVTVSRVSLLCIDYNFLYKLLYISFKYHWRDLRTWYENCNNYNVACNILKFLKSQRIFTIFCLIEKFKRNVNIEQ